MIKATKDSIVKKASDNWSEYFVVFRKFKAPMVKRLQVYKMAWCMRMIRRVRLSEEIQSKLERTEENIKAMIDHCNAVIELRAATKDQRDLFIKLLRKNESDLRKLIKIQKMRKA